MAIGYARSVFKYRERNYSTAEKEYLALVWATCKFKPYLKGYHFTAITDHNALTWPMKQYKLIMKLQNFDFKIKYRKGALIHVANALSCHQ